MFERTYLFAWLGILAEAPPASDELIYASHERGFALLSMRSPTLGRLYFQVEPGEDLAGWPDERVWAELHARLETGDGWKVAEGRAPEGRHRHAQLRRRADAARPAVPGRRRGTSSRRRGPRG